MKDLPVLYDQLKVLYDDELYEDVKLLGDLLIGYVESSTISAHVDSKDKYMLYYYYGNSAFNLKEYRLAEFMLNKAIQINKSNVKVKLKTSITLENDIEASIKYNLYVCLKNEKKYHDALQMLESIPLKSRNSKVLLALGKLYQTLSNSKEAINAFKELLKTTKLSLIAIDALLNLGIKLDDLPKLPASMNTEWLNLYLKAKSHFYQREFKDAIQLFSHLDLTYLPKCSEILCRLATSQYLNGDYSNALNTFDKLHNYDPFYTSKMDVYAYLLYNDKSDRDKLSTLEKLATDLYSISLQIPETWIAMGYFQLKKKPAIVKLVADNLKCFIDNALAIDNQNCQALLLKAITFYKSKTPSETINVYREATRINPYFFEAYKGHVDVLLNTNQAKDAIQVASACHKIIGSNHRTLTLYGEALSKESSTQEKSKSLLLKALKMEINNQEAVVCLVKVCMALKHFDDALDVLGKYIRHNPTNSRLLQTYVELLKKFKRNDEALVCLNKLVGILMSVKRASEFENGALVPVAKRVRNEVATYAAKQNRSVTRNSNLLSPIMLLSGHEGEIFTCKFSPQGDIIASAGFERKIFLWNVYGDCENWAVLMGHGGAIMDLQFNEDGSEMVSCSTDKSIFIWDINTCERIKKLKGHKSFVNSVSIARTGSVPLICSGSDDSTVKVWDRRQKGASLTYDNKYQVLSVAFNKTGEQIFFGGIDNQIKVWDTRMAGGELLYTLRGHTDSITGLSISHDGNYIASNAMDNTIRLWDVRPFAPQERCVKIFIGHMHNFEKNLLRVSWSPQDDRIAAGSADKFVYVWDVNSQRILYKLPGHTGCVNEVDFHPLEPIISSCSSDKKIYLGEIL